jgi:hypothetical protein
MPTVTGQTDSLKTVTLASAILQARWGAASLAANGTVTVEVLTAYVGDGSEIRIECKDAQGGSLGTVAGKVYSDCFRAVFKCEKPNKTGGMVFEASLPKHNLKAKAPALKVYPPVQVKNLQWKDPESGQVVHELYQGDKVQLWAAVFEGPIEGEAWLTIRWAPDDGSEPLDYPPLRTHYSDKLIKLTWLPSGLVATEPGKLSFTVGLLGSESTRAPEIPYLPNPTELVSDYALQRFTRLAKELSPASFKIWMGAIFGRDLEYASLESLQKKLRAGSIQNPPILVVPRRDLRGHDGAYHRIQKQMLVSSELLHAAAAAQGAGDGDGENASATLLLVLMEEFGHYIDDTLRTELSSQDLSDGDDIHFDEGEAFAHAMVLILEDKAKAIPYGTCKVRGVQTTLATGFPNLAAEVDADDRARTKRPGRTPPSTIKRFSTRPASICRPVTSFRTGKCSRSISAIGNGTIRNSSIPRPSPSRPSIGRSWGSSARPSPISFPLWRKRNSPSPSKT